MPCKIIRPKTEFLLLLQQNTNSTVRGNAQEQSSSSLNNFLPELEHQEQQHYDEEPLEETYTEYMQKAVEGEKKLGVIVRCEHKYSVIWSPDFQLIRMQLLNEQDPDHQPDVSLHDVEIS